MNWSRSSLLIINIILAFSLVLAPLKVFAQGPPPGSIVSFTFSPASVSGGTSSTATIIVSPAPTAPTTVNLSSTNNSVASVPSSVTVPSGATTVTFPVTTFGVTTVTNVPIMANYVASEMTSSITVTPVGGSSVTVSLNPASVTGGSNSTGTVSISPTSSTVTSISLSSSNTAIGTVPSSISIPAGSTSATFTVSTVAVTSSTQITIGASNGSVQGSAMLTVNAVSSGLTLNLNPTSIIGGSSSTGTVTLSAPVSSNTTITLSSSNTTVVTTPSSVTVLAGSATATFPITTTSVTAVTNATINVTYQSSTASASLTVDPPNPNTDYWDITVQPMLSSGAQSTVTKGESTATLWASINFTMIPSQIYTVFVNVQWNITATWVAPDGAPPPSQVIVNENVKAQWDTDQEAISGSLDAGYGFQLTNSNNSHGLVQGINYQILQVQNNQVTWTLSQNASVEDFCLSSIDYWDLTSCNDYDTIKIQNLDVETSGGIVAPTIDNLLTGQQCTASLTTGDLVPIPTSYHWTLAAGASAPFQWWTWSFTNNTATGIYTDMSNVPTNTATYSTHFARPDMSGAVKFSCVVTLNVPQSTSITIKPQGGFGNVTLLQRKPINVNPVVFNNLGIQIGYVKLVGNAVGAASLISPINPNQHVGIIWNAQVTTPAAFVQANQNYPDGLWMFVQLIEPKRPQITLPSYVLDNTCPYTYCVPANPPFFADTTQGTFADGPWVPLQNPPPSGVTTYEPEDFFKTYVMYQPPGSGSAYVPVDLMIWSWSQIVNYVNGFWTLPGKPNAVSASVDPIYSDKFPVWNSYFKNS